MEREDVNPEQLDTKNGRTPLSWAIEKGYEGVIKILSEHRGVAKILPERENPDSDNLIPGSQTSLPLSTTPREDFGVAMQSRTHDPNTDITDLNSLPQPLSTAHNEQVRELDRQDSIPESADNSPQPNSPGGPGFFPSDPETSSTAEGKPLPAAHDEQVRELGRQYSIPESADNSPQSNIPGVPDFFPSDPETSSSAEGKPLPAAHAERERLPDLRDSISRPTDPPPQTQLPWWSRILCIRPQKLFRRRRKTKTHLNNP